MRQSNIPSRKPRSKTGEGIKSRGFSVAKESHSQQKGDGYHAGLAQKWIGPNELDQCLKNGVYSLRRPSPVKVHVAELKVIKQPLWPNYTRGQHTGRREKNLVVTDLQTDRQTDKS